jgi:FAD dependent oxidoreductase
VKKRKSTRVTGSRNGSASKVLAGYKLATDTPLYLVGAFNANVTVLSQQIRALNLTWAMVEESTVPTRTDARRKLAIVGAGFTGLTLAAALLRKRTALDITIFEERDTLLPLQQGSDSRWLHPQIYEWPDEGSEASAAMLPVLNWTAGRASDVVVQVLSEWQRVVKEEVTDENHVRLFCNTRHLQIDRCRDDDKKAQIEWVGEPRKSSDGTTKAGEAAAGSSESFDFVVMAVGFGPELDAALSYWRNETLGQPSLNQARNTYLVSGQGDGAMIDLLRLRISQYRQDRILDELFAGKKSLLAEIKKFRADFSKRSVGTTLFQNFETLGDKSSAAKSELLSLLEGLRHRLRRDTEVILHLKVRNLADLFDGQISRMSFQNALLVYLLYKCGGFAPSTEKEEDLTSRLAIKPEHVIRRHGTDRLRQFRRLLSEKLYGVIEADQKSGRLHQEAKIQWKGGYFGIPGRLSDIDSVPDTERKTWRKEYLPGPTALLATAVCGAVVGSLVRLKPKADRFRVTLHRVLRIHEEDALLQQACDYLGPGSASNLSGAGRTFPAENATIGQAYACHNIVRSRRAVDRESLQKAMTPLKLNAASSSMAQDVGFVLAIPILQPPTNFFRPSRVAGIVYIDSGSCGFWLSDFEISELCTLIRHVLDGLQDEMNRPFDRLRNIPQGDVETKSRPPAGLPDEVADTLELLTSVSPPTTDAAFHFNFEHSDLTPVSMASDGSNNPRLESPHA